jgi:hypothetical protein
MCKRLHRAHAQAVVGAEPETRSASDLALLAWEACIRNYVGEAANLASRASRAATSASRRERRIVEVVCVAVAGDGVRALRLAVAHLVEFPDDKLVRRVELAAE